MNSASLRISPSRPTAIASLWVNRGLEALWLIAVVLVPIAFLDRDQILSEAVIGYVEIPKVALLRTLAGLMAVLWIAEWALSAGQSRSSSTGDWISCYRPANWIPGLAGWLRHEPTRWVVLSVWIFLLFTLLTTALSGSINISLWGEIPGQDGYSAYTIVAYVVLFGVIATHLRTQGQLWRLMGAIVVTGVLVSGYGVLQHYEHDFLNLTEHTGGGEIRVTAFMGNAIFAAAVMMMTIPVTLVAATLTLREPVWTEGRSEGRLGEWLRAVTIAVIWGSVLAVQLLGITFTLSRGPWLGTIVAVVTFLGLSAVFLGWNPLRRATLVLGISGALALAILQWQLSVSILGQGPWFSILVALAGIIAVGVFFASWRIVGRIALAAVLAVMLASGIILGPSWFRGDDSETDVPASESTASQVAERFSSIKGEVLGGFVTGRGTHWKTSWKLIRDRPWFAFDNLSVSWLRPLIGYGPDLFRYTYLLESPPGDDLLPLEPDHAHNYFIHQTVEQGLLGLLSSLAIFAAVLGVGGYQLIRLRQTYSPACKLVMIALLAVVIGRFLEMMVGVARVSDLTILWVILAVFVALPQVDSVREAPIQETSKPPTPRRQRDVGRAGSASAPTLPWGLFWRLAIVAWLVGGIAVFTWVKGVNNVRAAMSASDALDQLRQGDFQSSLALLDQATDLTPDVPVYYNYKANVYRAYLVSDKVPREINCNSQTKTPYEICLAIGNWQNNLDAKNQRPFYYRSRFALARSTSTLASAGENPDLNQRAVQFYQQTLAMVPSSWLLRNELAQAYIDAGEPQSALEPLEHSLVITADRADSLNALLLLALAYKDLGDPQKSVDALLRAEQLHPAGAASRGVYDILGEAYVSLGQIDLAGNAFSRQGMIDLEAGESVTSAELELTLGPLDQSNELVQAYIDALVITADTEDAINAFWLLGLAYKYLGDMQKSVDALLRAKQLDPAAAASRGVYGILAEGYVSLGQNDLAGDAYSRQAIIDLEAGETAK